MKTSKVPKSELDKRIERFTHEMDTAYESWELCAITGAVSLYYLTGTICDGLLLIRRNAGATLWARRSYERALLESEFADIREMTSFRDVAAETVTPPDTLYLDMAHATMEWYALLSRYLRFENVLPVDNVMQKIRSVKSDYELDRMRRAGSTIDRLLRAEIPLLLRPGISEADLGAEIFSLFLKNGYHGVNRFSMRNTEVLLGQVAFGDSTFYPSVFNGASGIAGLCPAIPALGSRDRLLSAGDLIFLDIGFGIDGYNIDKTLVFSFKQPQPEYIEDAQRHCLDLERLAASLLKSGNRPSDIYQEVAGAVRDDLKHRFMGIPGRTVPFIGHSVGLYVDETPVIAKQFTDPLQSGMTIAIEPKMGFEGVGIIGSENTYLVTEAGGVSLTGAASEIIVV